MDRWELEDCWKIVSNIWFWIFPLREVGFIASGTAHSLRCVLWEYSEEDIKVYHRGSGAR